MLTREELEELPPTAYLVWENFRRADDSSILSEQLKAYLKGFRIGERAKRVFIEEGGVWFAEMPENVTQTHFEVIGGFPNSGAFWKGILDTRAPLHIYRKGSCFIIR